MIYLLSYRGRGAVVLPMIAVPLLLSVLAQSIRATLFLLAFSVGFILIVVSCFWLGRLWIIKGRDDQFCGASVRTWGIIYGVFGLLFLVPSIHTAFQKI